MKMAVTIDPRPTYFGDRMIVTGSYEAGDTTIELGGLLASIDGTSYAAVTASNIDTAIFSDTTITIAPVFTGETTTAGTFVAIGRRS